MGAEASRTYGAPPAALNWLLIALALVMVPHALRMPLWIGATVYALGGWRWAIARWGLPLPGRWVLAVLAAAGIAGVYASYGRVFGRDAGIAMLALMLGLKLLETRGYRDSFVLAVLAYFLVITNFFHTQGILIALYMLGVVFVITGALVHLNHRGEGVRPFRLAGKLLLQSLPVMLVLFVLFPRIPGPLWGLPSDAVGGVTGLSDEMSPGSISRLTQSESVAFRVEFKGPPPPGKSLYWRGPILWTTDGRSWKGGVALPATALRYTALSPPLDYAVTLEPSNKTWLFALDLPARAPEIGRVMGGFQLLADAPVTQRTRYTMSSRLEYRTEELSPLERRLGLQLPGANPRTVMLARAWARELQDPAKVVERALAFFRDEGFRYTLSPPLMRGGSPVDVFLFQARQGFCEHYAGAFVTLMRAAGIPARVVTGYQGGDFNTFGGYLIVRQSDAHAWAEVWLEGRGWVRVDPTAAVSPARVEEGITAAVPAVNPLPGLVPDFLVQRDNPFIQRLRFGWDVLNGGWQLWVLSYTEERQLELLARLGLGLLTWSEMGYLLLGAVGGVMGVLALFMLVRRPARVPPEVRLYRRFCARLARRGLPRRAEEGPEDYARRVSAARPEWREGVWAVTAAYVAVRYGEKKAVREALRQAVRAFRP